MAAALVKAPKQIEVVTLFMYGGVPGATDMLPSNTQEIEQAHMKVEKGGKFMNRSLV